MRAADRSAELLRLVLDGIEETDSGDGVTGIEIWRLLSHPLKQDEMDPYSKLRAAVAELCGAKMDARKIGYRLRSYVGRICGGRRLINDSGHKGVTRWRVENLSGGHGGHGGDENRSVAGEGNMIQYHGDDPNAIRSQSEEREICPLCPPSPPDGNGQCDHLWESSYRNRQIVVVCSKCLAEKGF